MAAILGNSRGNFEWRGEHFDATMNTMARAVRNYSSVIHHNVCVYYIHHTSHSATQ